MGKYDMANILDIHDSDIGTHQPMLILIPKFKTLVPIVVACVFYWIKDVLHS